MVDGLSRSLDRNSNREVAADLTILLSFVAVKCEPVQQYHSQVL